MIYSKKNIYHLLPGHGLEMRSDEGGITRAIMIAFRVRIADRLSDHRPESDSLQY